MNRVWIAVIAALLVPAAQAQSNLDAPRDHPRFVGVWRGEGGGWSVTVEVTRQIVTPERVYGRVRLVCANESREQPWWPTYIFEGSRVELLNRHPALRGGYLRVAGRLPVVRITQTGGTSACDSNTRIELTRE